MFTDHKQTLDESCDVKFVYDAHKVTQVQSQSVCEYLNTSTSGLSTEEAYARMQILGENTIKSEKTFHPIKKLLKNFFNLMAIMLWVASILAIISGTPILAYVIWFIIVINAIFSFIQENKADKALQALAKMIPNNVKVYRDGDLTVIGAEQLVTGDVVSLSAGDKVPADIRIIEVNELSVDNSMLTGESVPVERDEQADTLSGESIINSRNLLFAGTSISGGEAIGVVYATGTKTQIGNITKTTEQIKRRTSTLEVQIRKITKMIIVIAVVLGILAFLISTFVTEFEVNEALIFAIGIIVANIPEGLMPTVSFSLALSVQRMAKKNALVRKQSAVETLSSTTVICTDKTGTLTQNKMFAKKIWTADGLIEISGEGYGKKGTLSGVTKSNEPTLERLFTAVSICSDTVLRTDKEDETLWKVIGNPTEAAMIIAANKFGLNVDNVKSQFKKTLIVPFSSDTKSMTVLAMNQKNACFPENKTIQFTKGDPVKIINDCQFIFKDGKPLSMTNEDRQQLQSVNDEMAESGYRILAVAYSDQVEGSEPSSNQLILLGLTVVYDPPKEGVLEAVADCYRAGIKVTIVTGDYIKTAVAIAKQVGIVKDQYVAITGEELERMGKEELASKINTALPVIFARTTPKEKLKIVETYQSLGHVVASTGDGLNDVLALRKADIGISMGKNGSDAAIESSDVVLLDDNFATIVEAVKEGRAIYENIRKFITYILASNIPEIIPFIVMGIFNIPLALTILLVLAIDLGTDLIPAIALGKELPEEDVLDYPPRKPNENILNKHVLFRAYTFLGLIEASMLFVMFFFAWNYFGYSMTEVRTFTLAIADGTASAEVMYAYSYAVTLAFGAVIACQIGNVLECRSLHLPLYRTMKKKNSLILWGIITEVVLFLLIAYVPFLQAIFGTTGPQIGHLALLLLCPILLILLEEFRKWRGRAKSKDIKVNG